jgi:DNA gyrase subunit A
MGRTARGVRAISLKSEDRVVSADAAREDSYLLSVTENGYGKRTVVSDYRKIKRGGQGVINIIASERNGKVVGAVEVGEEVEEVMIVTQKGVMIRQSVEEIRETGRNAQGVRLIRLDEGDRVAAITKMIAEEKEEGETPVEDPPSE